MLKKLFVESIKRNMLPMIFYLAAIICFAAQLFLVQVIGAIGFNQNIGFVLACLMAFTGLFFQTDKDKKSVISILMTVVFCVLAYVCFVDFLSSFISMVEDFAAYLLFDVFAYAIYLTVAILLIIFSLKQFKPNAIVFVMLFVGLIGVVFSLIAVLIIVFKYKTFIIDIFTIAIPACFFLGTFFFIKKEFSDGTEIKVFAAKKKIIDESEEVAENPATENSATENAE